MTRCFILSNTFRSLSLRAQIVIWWLVANFAWCQQRFVLYKTFWWVHSVMTNIPKVVGDFRRNIKNNIFLCVLLCIFNLRHCKLHILSITLHVLTHTTVLLCSIDVVLTLSILIISVIVVIISYYHNYHYRYRYYHYNYYRHYHHGNCHFHHYHCVTGVSSVLMKGKLKRKDNSVLY